MIEWIIYSVGIVIGLLMVTNGGAFVYCLLSDDKHQRTMRNIAELERELYPNLPKDLRWYDDGGDKFVAVKDPNLVYDRDEGYIAAKYLSMEPGKVFFIDPKEIVR